MRLPADFVKENLALAEGSLFFGVPILELERDELIAMAISGWAAAQKAQESEHGYASRQFDTFRRLRRGD